MQSEEFNEVTDTMHVEKSLALSKGHARVYYLMMKSRFSLWSSYYCGQNPENSGLSSASRNKWLPDRRQMA